MRYPMRSRLVVSTSLAAALFWGAVSAAGANAASVRLEKGKFLEETQGKLDQAIEVYEKVVEEAKAHRPIAAEALYRLAECYVKKGRPDRARAFLQEIVADFSDQKSFATKATERLAKIGPSGGLVSLHDVVERTVNDDGVLEDCFIDFEKGRLLTPPKSARSNKAKVEWTEAEGADAMAKTKASGPGLYGFKMIALPVAAERFDSTDLEAIEEDLSIGEPGTPTVLSALGDLPRTYAFQTREGSVGLLQIREIVKKSPRGVKIRYKLLKHGPKSGAAAVVSKEDRLKAEDLGSSAWNLWKQRKLSQAEEGFKKAIALDPNVDNYQNGLGWAQFNQGKRNNAELAFNRCLALTPKHAAALNGLGWIADAREKTDTTIEFWEKAIRAAPSATASLSGLARTYMARKDYKKAIQYYEQWLKYDRENADALDGLKKAKALMEDSKKR